MSIKELLSAENTGEHDKFHFRMAVPMEIVIIMLQSSSNPRQTAVMVPIVEEDNLSLFQWVSLEK